MKSTIQRALFAVAVATLGAGAVGTASAQTTTTPAPATKGAQHPHHRGHFRHGGGSFVSSLLRATKQLNLTTDQQSSIKSILAASGPARGAGTRPQHPALAVMGNPGDRTFASAVQNAQSAASGRVQKDSALAGQIYGVLNTAQRQALPGVLASIDAKEQARRAAWAAKRASSNG